MAEASMRLTRITALLALWLMLVSCGGGNSDTINGNWTATLSGGQVLKFTVALNQTSPPDVDMTNFNFTTPTPCFDAFHGQSATFTSSGIVNGNITGAFTLGIGTLFPEQPQNELNLQGNVSGKTITGNWTLSGGASTGCNSDSGSFKMTKS
jgi:hypothetical protein